MPRITLKGAPKAAPVPPADDRIFGAQAVADEYGCSRRYVYKLAADHRIHVWKLGSKNVYSRSQLDGLLTLRDAA